MRLGSSGHGSGAIGLQAVHFGILEVQREVGARQSRRDAGWNVVPVCAEAPDSHSKQIIAS